MECWEAITQSRLASYLGSSSQVVAQIMLQTLELSAGTDEHSGFCNRQRLLPYTVSCGRHASLMVSVLDSRSSSPGSRPNRGHFVVRLGKAL